MMTGTRACGFGALLMVLYCRNDNMLSIGAKVILRLGASQWPRPLSRVFLFARFGPAVGGVGQAEVFAQRLAFVFLAEQTAPLQLGDQQVDDVLKPAREGQRQDIEAVGRAAAEPELQAIGDFHRRADHHAVAALAVNALDELANTEVLA